MTLSETAVEADCWLAILYFLLRHIGVVGGSAKRFKARTFVLCVCVSCICLGRGIVLTMLFQAQLLTVPSPFAFLFLQAVIRWGYRLEHAMILLLLLPHRFLLVW